MFGKLGRMAEVCTQWNARSTAGFYCPILVQFFSDFFTKENKKQATLGNEAQRKSLKNILGGEDAFAPKRFYRNRC